jgi:hypothetical protein
MLPLHRDDDGKVAGRVRLGHLEPSLSRGKEVAELCQSFLAGIEATDSLPAGRPHQRVFVRVVEERHVVLDVAPDEGTRRLVHTLDQFV